MEEGAIPSVNTQEFGRYWYERGVGFWMTAKDLAEDGNHELACHNAFNGLTFIFKSLLTYKKHPVSQDFELPQLYEAIIEYDERFTRIPDIHAVIHFYSDTSQDAGTVNVGLFDANDVVQLIRALEEASAIVRSIEPSLSEGHDDLI